MTDAVEILESEMDFLHSYGHDEGEPVYLITSEGLTGVLKAYAELQTVKDGSFFGKTHEEWQDDVWELQHDYICRLEEIGHVVHVEHAFLPRK